MNVSRVLFVLAAAVIALAALGVHPVAAADDPCGWDCVVNGDDFADAYRGAILIPGTGFVGLPGLRATASHCEGCEWGIVPWCLWSQPGSNASCLGSVISCPAGGLRYALFLRRPGEAAFQRVGSFCQVPGQPLTPDQLIPDVRDRFLDLLPALKPTFQPPDGALVNLPAVFASGQPRLLGRHAFDLAGFGIVLTADASWVWDFGDGTQQAFSVPGGRYPDLGVSHTYRTTGSRTVSVTTTWAGEFTVDGLGPFAVTGPAVQQAGTVAVPVREARAQLVAGQ